MRISVIVDDAAWQRQMDVLLVASEEQARLASEQGAQQIREEARFLLQAKRHDRYTYSPSARGEPPAMISGDLAASMSSELFGDEAWVGPTAGYGRTEQYARIQELGEPPMRGHPYMHFFLEGRWWRRAFIQLPARPYLEPATEDIINSGRLWLDYYEHQLDAILEAT